MKRYKLLKDLPTFKAGDEFYLDGSGLWTADGEMMAYNAKTLEKFPEVLTDWFEEIADKPWRAERDGKYWFISNLGPILPCFDARHRVDSWRYEHGNYFRTEKGAEKEAEKQRAWTRLKNKGFRFDDWTKDSGDSLSHQVIRCDFGEADESDLDLLFGGEE